MRELGGDGAQAGCMQGSRRPSVSSVQSSGSSIRSYSARRWERDREARERRQASARLAQLQEKMSRAAPAPSPAPSPRSPNNSTDGLLPALCELREVLTLFTLYVSFKSLDRQHHFCVLKTS
ncbi:hypothetical protein EVAR_30118_1 [Eumeta japonica]|uniref:Uncharacterized protein n=1 Tax=Eumeta variegata TaxID=151549 RepID=A0A4C1WHR5_EUMVA|nr:hypothetical protein EVAR_30118_1 [Eumeta japonica]